MNALGAQGNDDVGERQNRRLSRAERPMAAHGHTHERKGWL